MPYIDKVLTTNWDTNVEDLCGATPFITGEDVALWDVADRKVLKIHGSISNLGTIIATSDDYERNFETLSKGVMGAQLKTSFATDTVVFVGYSLRDWNILQLYSDLIADLGMAAPRSFKVSPSAAPDPNLPSVEPIRTSGIHFLRTLKKKMLNEGYLDDRIYDRADELYAASCDLDPRECREIDPHEFPEVIYAWFYNDGIRDALDRISRFRPTGMYSDKKIVLDRLYSYDVIISRAIEQGKFGDAAYLTGYSDGLAVLIEASQQYCSECSGEVKEEEEPLVPIFQYDSGQQIQNLQELAGYLREGSDKNSESYKWAESRVEHLPKGFVLSHTGELTTDFDLD
ncbi:hypothetical protein GCM10009631_11630 [Corynebacterium glaucum]